MATTSSNLAADTALAAGKATTGHGGNGKGHKGRAVAAVATAALGLSLVVGGLLGQGRQPEQAAQPSTNPFASDTHVSTVWDFREDRRAETHDLFIPDQFTYREDRRAELVSTFAPDQFTYREDRRVPAGVLDWEQQERTQVAPGTFSPANVALARTLAGNGYLEFSSGEAAVVSSSASSAASGAGLSPTFGPQP